MCGLAGMCGVQIHKDDRDMYRELLYVTSLRGPHSTGLFTAQPLAKKDVMKMKKITVSSPEFISLDMRSKAECLLDDFYADLFMGHCRWATVGEVTRANSHPFDVGNLVGAHNGTLNDLWSFGKKGEDKTDSQIMFEMMNKDGIEKVLRDLHPQSAYAISVYDKKTKKLTLARNKDRPLFVAFNKDRGVLYWASDAYMLEFAANRNGINIETVYLEARSIYEIDIEEVKIDVRAPWKVTKLPEQKFKFSQWPKKFETSASEIVYNTEAANDTPWWEAADTCCHCEKLLGLQEQLRLQPVRVDGTDYWICEECANDSEKELAAERKRRLELQEANAKDANNQNIVRPLSSDEITMN